MVARRVISLSFVGLITIGSCSTLPSPSDTETLAQRTPTPATALTVAVPDTNAIPITTPDECSLLEERSFALLEKAYAQIPPPPQEAELLVQSKGGRCETGVYHMGSIYGSNGEEGGLNLLEKYYWDPLSDQGWEVLGRMATNPRPIFCHPDYESVQVDIMLLYEPPDDIEESYETLYGIELSSHWTSEPAWECKGIEVTDSP